MVYIFCALIVIFQSLDQVPTWSLLVVYMKKFGRLSYLELVSFVEQEDVDFLLVYKIKKFQALRSYTLDVLENNSCTSHDKRGADRE